MRLRTGLLAALIALLCALPAAAAQNPVIQDCSAHNTLSRTYSTQQLKDALANMPVDVKEYTDCYNIVDRALLSQLHGGDGSGGSFLPGWLIAVLVAVLLGGAIYGGLVLRRRRTLSPAGTAIDSDAPPPTGGDAAAEAPTQVHPEPPTEQL